MATASIATRPLSGLFGISKPSGPTSMSLLDQLKPLFASSSLFADADGKAINDNGGKKQRCASKYAKNKRRGAPKIGQGGTLDPLADGVLVIGVGSGTKHLQKYLECTKEYRTIALLGTATTSYDSCDPILHRAPFHHVDATSLTALLPRFTGTLSQIPPLYSAVRIDGKRLFEYARAGLELPRPIEARKVRVDELRLVGWLPAGTHAFKEPEREVPDDEKALVGRVRKMAGRGAGMTDTRKVEDETETETETVQGAVQDAPPATGEDIKAKVNEPPTAAAAATEPEQGTPAVTSTPVSTETSEAAPASSSSNPPAFTLEMTVSSGTYVRSIVHDLAAAAGSAAHVQVLTRTRQGEWSINTPASSFSATQTQADGEAAAVIKGNCLAWKVFEDGIEEMNKEQREPGYKSERDEQGLRAWERELLRVIVPV